MARVVFFPQSSSIFFFWFCFFDKLSITAFLSFFRVSTGNAARAHMTYNKGSLEGGLRGGSNESADRPLFCHQDRTKYDKRY